MLVHPSVGTTDHEKWKGWVDGVIRDDKKFLSQNGQISRILVQ